MPFMRQCHSDEIRDVYDEDCDSVALFAWSRLDTRASLVGSLALDAVLDDPRMLLHFYKWYPLLWVEYKQLRRRSASNTLKQMRN